MKRPIPEGVTLPHPNAIILGWGGDFKVPKGGFEGYVIWPGLYPDWDKGHKQGDDESLIYAADAGSEVERLNDPARKLAIRLGNEISGNRYEPKKIITFEEKSSETVTDPCDGAIRALVQKWREEADIRSNGNAALAMMECADELEAALKNLDGRAV